MRSECPDCDGKLVDIQVIDRGFMDTEHQGFVYASGGVKPSFVTGSFKTAGTVEARMCESCSRVFFYAVPKK